MFDQMFGRGFQPSAAELSLTSRHISITVARVTTGPLEPAVVNCSTTVSNRNFFCLSQCGPHSKWHSADRAILQENT